MPEYTVHDNGGKPFRVVIYEDNDVYIYKDDNGRISDSRPLKVQAECIWIGDNILNDKLAAPRGMYPGNSILLHLHGDKYMFVGWKVYEFEVEPGDAIVKYYSPVGNSDVPYPYAVGKFRTYFMLEEESLPSSVLNLKEDAYKQFYGLRGTLTQKQIKEMSNRFRGYRLKRKRIY